jgi:sporulation protein YlmC with PRC-barrel domain
MTIRSEDVNRIAGGGGEVRTSSGEKVGKVGQVYLDDETGQPSWVTVKTGLFGTQESFVPLSSADLVGEDIVVPYDQETIKGAPRMDTDASLSPQEEKRLYSYYFSASPIGAGATRDQDALDQDDDRRSGFGDEPAGRSDQDRQEDDQTDRGRTTDDRLGDESDKPRLRKYVVTEEVVQVKREELPVEDSDRI